MVMIVHLYCIKVRQRSMKMTLRMFVWVLRGNSDLWFWFCCTFFQFLYLGHYCGKICLCFVLMLIVSGDFISIFPTATWCLVGRHVCTAGRALEWDVSPVLVAELLSSELVWPLFTLLQLMVQGFRRDTALWRSIKQVSFIPKTRLQDCPDTKASSTDSKVWNYLKGYQTINTEMHLLVKYKM